MGGGTSEEGEALGTGAAAAGAAATDGMAAAAAAAEQQQQAPPVISYFPGNADCFEYFIRLTIVAHEELLLCFWPKQTLICSISMLLELFGKTCVSVFWKFPPSIFERLYLLATNDLPIIRIQTTPS